MTTASFLFDAKLCASIRVPAATASEARAKLIEALEAAGANFGAWPDGSPILGEVSLSGDDDGIDGIEYLELVEDDDA